MRHLVTEEQTYRYEHEWARCSHNDHEDQPKDHDRRTANALQERPPHGCGVALVVS